MAGQDHRGLYVNGQEVDSVSGDTFTTSNPATEAALETIALSGPGDVDLAVDAARASLDGPWHRTSPRERGERLLELARLLEERAEELARLETADTGKPLSRSRREMGSTVRYFRYYAGAADKIHGEQIPLGPDYVDFTVRDPLGVTAHIVPWNAPLNMVARSVAPALASGCTAVVKPALETPLTALELGWLMRQAGLPDGVYNAVPGAGPEVGGALTRHPGVDGITFTGSVATGREIMRNAAQHIRPVVLELGGKSPSMVLSDASLPVAADEIVKGIYSNSGQFCNASSRVLVDESVKSELVRLLVERAEALSVGPGDRDPDMGPLISQQQLDRVLGYIDAGRTEGGTVLTGGQRPAGFERGHFVAPTIIDDIDLSARVSQEEVFGPVLTVHSFGDQSEAVELANAVPYGLAAGVFTNDLDRAMKLAMSVKAGQVYVNEYFAGDEETPFGGYKQSGFGREKGLEAIRNYTQVKNVAIRLR